MRKFLPLLALLLFGLPCRAAIAFDAVSSANSGSSFATATSSWTHTTTGSNLALVCEVSWQSASVTVSSVTYNSVGLTVQQNVITGNNTYNVWIGVLLGPASGANTVLVTMSTGSTAFASCMSFTGVNQSAVDSSGCNNKAVSGAVGTCNVTTVAANAWIVDALCLKDNNGSFPANSPQVGKFTGGGAFANPGAGASYNGPIVTPAATSDGWTDSSTSGWSVAAFSLAPAGAGGSSASSLVGPAKIVGPSVQH